MLEENNSLIKGDENIISEALIIKEKEKCNISSVILSKNKARSEKSLRDSMAMGVDSAYIIEGEEIDLEDPRFCAEILKTFIENYFSKLDIILIGSLFYNEDSVYVSTYISESLNIKRILYSSFFDVKGNIIYAKREIGNEEYSYSVDTPIIIQSINENTFIKNLTIAGIINAYSEKEIFEISLSELIEGEKCLENKVELNDEFYLEIEKNGELICLTGEDDNQSASNLVEILKKLVPGEIVR
ncbi:hypothetical protein [Anaerosphaera multitolerans]|uniref:hypothetical protein n=1 Tax=Anaerosphaera multitolerans TaxID=2487351 RepID=UPI0013E2BFD7|nr:hypothetical protein [Anaerosphaera multitolerans]